jgi:hypothetical protein
MTHHALLEYIRTAKDRGATDQEVAERLGKAGWYRVDIDDAVHLHAQLMAVPVASLPERAVTRSYDPYLVAVAGLSFAVGFVVYVVLAH